LLVLLVLLGLVLAPAPKEPDPCADIPTAVQYLVISPAMCGGWGARRKQHVWLRDLAIDDNTKDTLKERLSLSLKPQLASYGT